MRKSLVVFAAVVLILAGGLFALLGPRHCPVNRAAFERVEEGMTPAEVDSALGLPPRDYRTRPPGPRYPNVEWDGPAPYGRPRHINVWHGDEGVAVVAYPTTSSGFGGVEGVYFLEAPPHSPGLIELARWRLRKLKESLLP